MQYRIVQDAHDGLWRWLLLDARSGRALARSLEAFVDASACRNALRSAFDPAVPAEWGAGQQSSAPASAEPAAGSEAQGGFEDVGLRRKETAAMSEGEAEPQPMPQIGR